MSKKVLLADDSVTIQKVVEIILASGDYTLLIADNGDSALSRVQADRPDIVLADVYMPGKNGYQLCAAVKQDETLSGTPVLLLSGTFEAFDESKALAAGADGWIAKPFESQALLDQIEELLARPAAVGGLTETSDAASATEVATSVAEPDMWADIEIETLEEEQSEEFLADVSSDSQDSFDEVELEADGLWDEEPLLGSDDQPVAEEDVEVDEIDFTELAEADTSSDGMTLAEDDAEPTGMSEDVLFLDESDLLLDEDAEPATLEEEETFEFVTLEDSATGTEEAAAESLPETPSVIDDAQSESQPSEESTDFAPVEKTAPETVEEVDADTCPGSEIEPDAVSVAEPEPSIEPQSVSEPEPAPEPEPETASAGPAVGGLSFFRSDGLISRLADTREEEPAPATESAASAASGLSFFRSEGLISRLADTTVKEPTPAVESEPPTSVAEPVSKEAVVERVQGLSEEELTAIVEQVAGKVIERLAATMLEKIAWEVVPDLAESMIKEEISRITASQD